MLEIDGSRHSGSGTIVRQALALAALTRRPVRIVNARSRRPKPGLRPQHLRVVEAIRDLAGATVEGADVGSREISFRPGAPATGRRSWSWDIGSAGSTTLLALAVLPVLAFGSAPASVELRGGLFQDFAPSFFALEHALLPLLRRMGLEAAVEMGCPGYVPRGEGVLRLSVEPVEGALRPLTFPRCGEAERIWGIALASHLASRGVSRRLAESAGEVFAAAGLRAEIVRRDDTSAPQPGAALACFADLAGGGRLAADQAGARGRPAEAIGASVANQLLEDLRSGACVDRHVADQVVPFAALADGESRFRIPAPTEHIHSCAWLAGELLGASVRIEGQELVVRGTGFRPPRLREARRPPGLPEPRR